MFDRSTSRCVSDSSQYIRSRAQYAAKRLVLVKVDLPKGTGGLTGHHHTSPSHDRAAHTGGWRCPLLRSVSVILAGLGAACPLALPSAVIMRWRNPCVLPRARVPPSDVDGLFPHRLILVVVLRASPVPICVKPVMVSFHRISQREGDLAHKEADGESHIKP